MTSQQPTLHSPQPPVRRSREDEDRISDALERIHDASQRLMQNRLELAIEQARRLLLCTGAAGAGALVALGGWTLVLVSAIRAIDDETTAVAVGVGLGALHVAGGLLLIQRALRAARGEST